MYAQAAAVLFPCGEKAENESERKREKERGEEEEQKKKGREIGRRSTIVVRQRVLLLIVQRLVYHQTATPTGSFVRPHQP